MQTTLFLRKLLTHPLFSLGWVLVLLFLLPSLGGVAFMLGSAAVFSLYVAVFPERFRNARGSLAPAVALLLFLWLMTVFVGLTNFVPGLRR